MEVGENAALDLCFQTRRVRGFVGFWNDAVGGNKQLKTKKQQLEVELHLTSQEISEICGCYYN